MGGAYTGPSQLPNLELADIQDAMRDLPDEQRTTLILVALEDMSYEEAARVTGVPVGTIRSRLSRARHALLEKIEGVEKTRAGLKCKNAPLQRRVAPRGKAQSLVEPMGSDATARMK